MRQGLIYVFTGDGKGKTSAALGTVTRAVGNDMRVGWVAWYKQASWRMSEVVALKRLGIEMHLLGKGFSMDEKSKELVDGSRVVNSSDEEDHKKSAQQALEKAVDLMDSVDVLVLDEVNNAVEEGLIDLIDLIDLISKRKHTHLILTGRNADEKVMEMADLVTQMKKIKHPYDKGTLAVKGLDF